MSEIPPSLVPDPSFTMCRVAVNIINDFYDGPLSGVVVIAEPIAAFAYHTIGERYNENGLDTRLAMVWPVSLDAVESLRSDPRLDIRAGVEGVSMISGDPHGVMKSVMGPVPRSANRFVAFTSERRFLAAWAAPSPVVLSPAAIERLLCTVPFEDELPSPP